MLVDEPTRVVKAPDEPTLVVKAPPDVPDEWRESFARYVCAHPADTRQFLNLRPDASVEFLVTGAVTDVEFRREGKGRCLVTMPVGKTRFILGRAEVRQLAGGMLTIPALYQLIKGGAFDVLEKASAPVNILELARVTVRGAPADKNAGYLLGGMRMMALQRWVEIDGVDENAMLRLGDQGRLMLGMVRHAWGSVTKSFDAIRQTKDYAYHLRAKAGATDAVVASLRALIDEVKHGWHIPDGTDLVSRRVSRQIRKLLDGTVLSPIFIAFGMPPTEREGDRLTKIGPSVLELFDARTHELREADARAMTHEGFLNAGLELLEHAGIVARAGGRTRLTEWGRAMQQAMGQFGVAGAYLKLYEVIDEVLYGNPDPLGRADDGHIDRVVNIWGSSGISTKLGEEVCTEVLRRVFDGTPLDQQPAGVADMGSGEGMFLKKVVEFISTQTRRGKHLAEYPLTVIAADYYDTPLRRSRETLKELAAHPHMSVAVIRGDVGNPDAYDQDIRALGIPWKGRVVGAADLVHTMVFLAHDRALSVTDRKDAMDVIRGCVARVDRGALAKALERSVGGPIALPEDEGELLELVLRQFTVSFASNGRLIPSVVAVGDFIEFLRRWGRYADHGVVIAELHVPRHTELQRELPVDEAGWLRSEMYGLHIWGFHFLTDQYPLPFREHNIVSVLAGLRSPLGEAGGGNLYFTGDMQNSINWYVNERSTASFQRKEHP